MIHSPKLKSGGTPHSRVNRRHLVGGGVASLAAHAMASRPGHSLRAQESGQVLAAAGFEIAVAALKSAHEGWFPDFMRS